ncbi:hypothetical protein DRE_01129 [Drechslerella stenobrocha 248]|uniref:Uncharacterized protein n=1 Tax=Drechslerella stenobrocha 248 TaxID=1043628 RepID=W7HWJ8_9PEZI|nr:hypothetical protein DRE_01129 [Drechslerella stenobrocha 248]
MLALPPLPRVVHLPPSPSSPPPSGRIPQPSRLELPASNTPPGAYAHPPTRPIDPSNTVEPVPSAPPPAYAPSQECRSSRIYDFGDFDGSNTTDVERAAPPPPYTASQTRRHSLGPLYAHEQLGARRPSEEAAEAARYESMSIYLRAAKRKRMCAAFALAVIIVIGIILIGNFIARLGTDSSLTSPAHMASR